MKYNNASYISGPATAKLITVDCKRPQWFTDDKIGNTIQLKTKILIKRSDYSNQGQWMQNWEFKSLRTRHKNAKAIKSESHKTGFQIEPFPDIFIYKAICSCGLFWCMLRAKTEIKILPTHSRPTTVNLTKVLQNWHTFHSSPQLAAEDFCVLYQWHALINQNGCFAIS